MLARGVTPESRFFLAPMAGITDSAFRTVCARFGAALTYTEMISAKALVYGDKKTRRLLEMEDEHRPCGVQIFGCQPDVCAEGARIAHELARPQLIDINMGCPVPKVVSNGDGCALMRDPPRAAAVIAAVVRAVPVPVTVKFRAGYTADTVNAPDFARMAEQSGAAAVCVHGRTREQFYAGSSDRGVIAAVKRAVSVPVIASGDASCASACLLILDETGADYIMIARGALGFPMIFRECLAQESGRPCAPPDAEELIDTLLSHARLMCARKGPHAVVEMRKHALWYLHRLNAAKPFKVKMSAVSDYNGLESLCAQMKAAGLTVKPR